MAPSSRAWADQTASTDEGRAKPELLMGTYQKFVAASVGEIQCWPYKNKNAYGPERVLKCILMTFMSPVVQSSSPVQ